MAFEIRKISDVGTANPIVARLGVQANDLINFINIDKAKRDELSELYILTLTQRLLRCEQIYSELVEKCSAVTQPVSPQPSQPRVQEVPHVMGLQAIAEGFLYEVKNYLRDLLQLFRIVYESELADASAFTNLKGDGDSELVKWASGQFGAHNSFTELLRTEQEWVAEPIRMRNAVEHPGGYSGKLQLNNIRLVPNQPGSYIPPTWARTGRPESSILADMECMLHNLLTVAEDLLAAVILDKSHFKKIITIVEIKPEERDTKCPIRLRVTLSPEMQGRLPIATTSIAAKPPATASQGKHLLRKQDRAWREKLKRREV